MSGPAEPQAVDLVTRLALGAGIQRISYVSGATVRPDNAAFPMVAQKLHAEQSLRAVADSRRLAASLARLARRTHPDPETARRLTAFADSLPSEEHP